MIILIISIIILVIILLILYFQIKQYNSITSTLEIIQINEITKDNLEKICRNNQPIVINRFPQKYRLDLNKTLKILCKTSYLKGKEKEILLNTFINNTNTKQYLIDWKASDIVDIDYLKLINNYHSPLSRSPNNTITIFNYTFDRNLTRSTASRNIYICLKGECIFRLYHPKNTKNIKFIKNINQYEISQYSSKDPILKEKTFIEIIIRENQGLIIPRYWMFNYYTKIINSKCILLNSKSHDFIGLFASNFNVI